MVGESLVIGDIWLGRGPQADRGLDTILLGRWKLHPDAVGGASSATGSAMNECYLPVELYSTIGLAAPDA